MILQPQDLKWVKSIKRDNGAGWAFFEEGYESEFPLTFSEKQKNGAEKIQPGEVILLFQRVDNMIGVKARTYLTHLVTPLDYLLSENTAIKHKFKWERLVKVVARATSPSDIFTHPADLSFSKSKWGKLWDIGNLHPTKTQMQIQEEVWRLFDGHFDPRLDNYLLNFNSEEAYGDNDVSVMEGAEKEVTRKHKIRERNRLIVGIAKARAIAKGKGTVHCECCDFDFRDFYGNLGSGFIECHHKQHISEGGERLTYPNDLAMVCSNCHRMLHIRNDEGKYYSVEELRKLTRKYTANGWQS